MAPSSHQGYIYEHSVEKERRCSVNVMMVVNGKKLNNRHKISFGSLNSVHFWPVIIISKYFI